MPNNEPVTLGEVARKVDSVAASVEDLHGQLADRPSWRDIQRVEEGWRSVVNSAEQRVADLESWQTWAGRLVLGAILTAVLALVLVPWPL